MLLFDNTNVLFWFGLGLGLGLGLGPFDQYLFGLLSDIPRSVDDRNRLFIIDLGSSIF